MAKEERTRTTTPETLDTGGPHRSPGFQPGVHGTVDDPHAIANLEFEASLACRRRERRPKTARPSR